MRAFLCLVLVLTIASSAEAKHRIRITRTEASKIEELEGRRVGARTSTGGRYESRGAELKAFLRANGVMVDRTWTTRSTGRSYLFAATHHQRARWNPSTVILGEVRNGILSIGGYLGYNRQHGHHEKGGETAIVKGEIESLRRAAASVRRK